MYAVAMYGDGRDGETVKIGFGFCVQAKKKKRKRRMVDNFYFFYEINTEKKHNKKTSAVFIPDLRLGNITE